jgi:serine/threonine protein kinase
MLSGTPPFNGNTDDDIHTSILRGVINWDPKDWTGISCEAIDFIRRLLQIDPKQRLTARQALQHPWMEKTNHARMMMKARQDHELLQDCPMKEICVSNGNTFHGHDCVSSSHNKLGTFTSCNESKSSSPSRPLSLRGLADNNNNTMSCSSNCTRTTYHPPYYNKIDPTTNRRGTLDTVCLSELDLSERSSVHVHQILDSSEKTSKRVLDGILCSANTRKRLTI